jgi:hypothetical protein
MPPVVFCHSSPETPNPQSPKKAWSSVTGNRLSNLRSLLTPKPPLGFPITSLLTLAHSSLYTEGLWDTPHPQLPRTTGCLVPRKTQN